MGAKRISELERNTIENYIKSGMSRVEISKITGRSIAAIRNIKYDMYGKKGAKKVEVPAPQIEEVVTTSEPEDTVRNHRDDPRFASNISIEMVAKIAGQKTGYSYRADFGKKVLTITTATGKQLELEFEVVEKFLDEMIDVSVEVGDLKKKFCA